jgi:nucleoside-diphosphate-sugar epimerase
MKFTIFGASGLIGSRLSRYLQSEGHEVRACDRRLSQNAENLGHVIYCIGLTADFRRRPIETIEAHAYLSALLLHRSSFESWLYLSSTRVYGGLGPRASASEENEILIKPSADTIYDLSKLLGEATCLGHEASSVRVARLSNVYSPDQKDVTFLGSVMKELREHGTVVIREAPESSKDYIAIDDVARLLVQICLHGRERLYNVASGVPTTHRQIAERLHELTGRPVTFAPGAVVRAFPRVSISRVQAEFSFAPRSLLDDLPCLL